MVMGESPCARCTAGTYVVFRDVVGFSHAVAVVMGFSCM